MPEFPLFSPDRLSMLSGSTFARPDGHFHQRIGVKQSDKQASGPITAPTYPTHPSSTTESGMIVFSSPTQILHMNGPARSLITLFGESGRAWSPPTHESLPSIFTEFCRDVLEQLRGRMDPHDWAQFEMRRVCYMVTPPILIRGFGIPDSASKHPRIILTLHSLGHAEHHSALDTVLHRTAALSQAIA